jgi:hypothetical protein
VFIFGHQNIKKNLTENVAAQLNNKKNSRPTFAKKLNPDYSYIRGMRVTF